MTSGEGKPFWIDDAFKKNIYSQYGEDGMISYLLEKLNIKNGATCEFGAWDGIHLSNTYNLSLNGFKSVMIECDTNKYSDLETLSKSNHNIIPICQKVTPYSINKVLNKAIEAVNASGFSVLSIDIDSYDALILAELSIPCSIVVIEYNCTFGIHAKYQNPYSDKVRIGSSFRTITDIAKQKDMSLVGVTKTNLIFASNKSLSENNLLPLDITVIERLDELFAHTTLVASGYDGRKILIGKNRHLWDSSMLVKVLHTPRLLLRWPSCSLVNIFRILISKLRASL